VAASYGWACHAPFAREASEGCRAEALLGEGGLAQNPPKNKNIENNPMHSSHVLAGIAFSVIQNSIDTSGKSGAQSHPARKAVPKSDLSQKPRGARGEMNVGGLLERFRREAEYELTGQ